ncbi:MAG: sugar phosphate isomerase/epimerase, partial [Chloroflexi bacterium]|nr:sugar phosphate isomerase/epimerase [Chloroflexota bacterium]
MRYGVCTWIFGDQPLPEIAAQLASLGYDGVELMGDLARVDAREVNTILGEHGLRVLSLTPQNVDLPHPEGRIRQEALDYYYRLLDLASALGNPIVCCHGAVGRVRAVTSYEEEWGLFVEAVRHIAQRAQQQGLSIAMEVLNRYEAHLLTTAREALRFIQEVGMENVGILLDAYHMNIEEADLRSAILAVREHLLLFHAADSNRQAVGRGHTDFIGIMRTLGDVGYNGSVIIECTASGPDPFTPIKGEGWRDEVWRYVAESLELLRMYERLAQRK